MSSFVDFNQASQVKGLSQQYPTTSMEGRLTGPASVKTDVWSDPQREDRYGHMFPGISTPEITRQHTFFPSSSDEESEEDWGKKTTVFNKKVVAESNLSDQSTDSEVEELTNQPELQEGFGRFSEESLPEIEDLTHLKPLPPPKKCVRQIGESKYQLPLKMLKHFKLDYIHVQTKWDWDMKDTWKGTVVGAWVYAIFKLQDDVEEKLKPKKVIIYVPEYYAKRAYEVGRKSFDDDSEFRQFLRSPQWWKEISDFDCRDV